MRATSRRAGPFSQAPPPLLVAGELPEPLMLAVEKLWSPATDLLEFAVRPGRRAVAAPAGALQRRPARAHARRRRFRTTRAAARPSEERENEERHAV